MWLIPYSRSVYYLPFNSGTVVERLMTKTGPAPGFFERQNAPLQGYVSFSGFSLSLQKTGRGPNAAVEGKIEDVDDGVGAVVRVSYWLGWGPMIMSVWIMGILSYMMLDIVPGAIVRGSFQMIVPPTMFWLFGYALFMVPYHIAKRRLASHIESALKAVS